MTSRRFTRARWWPRVGVAAGVLLLGVVAVPLVGRAALPVGLLLAALVALGPPRRGPVWVGALGAAVGVYSAASALVAVGGQPAYGERSVFGWLALLCAAAAGLAAAYANRYPRRLGLVVLALATLGFAAINLFYINTLYFAAWLLFGLAGAWALVMHTGERG